MRDAIERVGLERGLAVLILVVVALIALGLRWWAAPASDASPAAAALVEEEL